MNGKLAMLLAIIFIQTPFWYELHFLKTHFLNSFLYETFCYFQDFEVLMGEPLVEMLPVRPKSNFHKYILPVIIELMYLIYGIEQIPIRITSILQGKQKLRPENLIVLLELAIAVILSPSIWVKPVYKVAKFFMTLSRIQLTFQAGLSSWTIILCTSTFWFAFVSNNSSHHHTDCFHDGDEARPNPDFGYE